jgi:hypothetical protein
MRTNGDGKPVVALDIDGTLGDYHGNFLAFAWRYFDRGPKTWDPDKANPGLPLWEWMGIDLHQYREAKLAYRQGGWKRWMPCYSGAAALSHSVQRLGAEVWICTTRPYLRLDNVDPDTREWLRRNNIRYDAVLFDRVDEKGSKYQELRRQAGERLASVVDDLPEMILEAERLRLPGSGLPIIRNQPYNRHFVWPRRADDMMEVFDHVSRDISDWKAL